MKNDLLKAIQLFEKVLNQETDSVKKAFASQFLSFFKRIKQSDRYKENNINLFSKSESDFIGNIKTPKEKFNSVEEILGFYKSLPKRNIQKNIINNTSKSKNVKMDRTSIIEQIKDQLGTLKTIHDKNKKEKIKEEVQSRTPKFIQSLSKKTKKQKVKTIIKESKLEPNTQNIQVKDIEQKKKDLLDKIQNMDNSNKNLFP